MTRNARRATAAPVMDDLSGVRVECTHCKIRMTPHMGSGGQVCYFRCSSCQRWLSSTYAEVLRADASFRAASDARAGQEDRSGERFGEVKERLERWLAAIEAQDPCQVLGVSPADPTDRIRSRYRELAMQSHPDRGGSVDRMQEINLAYERLDAHRQRRKSEAAKAVAAIPVTPAALPARGK